jgi:hypothetical protein
MSTPADKKRKKNMNAIDKNTALKSARFQKYLETNPYPVGMSFKNLENLCAFWSQAVEQKYPGKTEILVDILVRYWDPKIAQQVGMTGGQCEVSADNWTSAARQLLVAFPQMNAEIKEIGGVK